MACWTAEVITTSWLAHCLAVDGALSHGMRAAWIQRSNEAIFDPWELEPTITACDLHDLKTKLASNNQ